MSRWGGSPILQRDFSSSQRGQGTVIDEREIATLVARFGMGNQLSGGLLLVDDEPNNLVVLRGFLDEEELWQVHIAASGDEALAPPEKTPLDVVVTDHRMPGMT